MAILRKDWKARFIEGIKKYRSTAQACEYAGVARPTAYSHRYKDEEFKKAWDNAWAINIDVLEASALKRAAEGWLEPLYYQGQKVGYVRKFSTGLTIFMLKCWRPEKYNIQDQSTMETAQERAKAVRDALKEMGATFEHEPKET